MSNNIRKVFRLVARDREVIELQAEKKGTITASVSWSDGPDRLAVILNGPGQIGYYARQDGTSPITFTYTLTSQDLARGKQWKVSVVNLSTKSASPVTAGIDFPGAEIIDEVPAALKKGERYSFESYNFPGYFIRHEYFLAPRDSLGAGGFFGEITKINSLFDKKDASFEVVPGLADKQYISFESLNRPGYFLRHQGFRLKLGKSSNDQGFKKDATFKVKPGQAFDSLVSFESLNYPGRYIRHRDFHLYLEKGNDNLFRKDATSAKMPHLELILLLYGWRPQLHLPILATSPRIGLLKFMIIFRALHMTTTTGTFPKKIQSGKWEKTTPDYTNLMHLTISMTAIQ
ncbi:MAG: AbfB domain-containing protein [Deltaproteobacteria bacterium]|nr:AbfB domain-containing protein [Deltaproteobacteria bacterium]